MWRELVFMPPYAADLSFCGDPAEPGEICRSLGRKQRPYRHATPVAQFLFAETCE
jgi:hypothetical protein